MNRGKILGFFCIAAVFPTTGFAGKIETSIPENTNTIVQQKTPFRDTQKVRVGFKLIKYKPKKPTTTSNKIFVEPSGIIKRTLRTSLLHINHFAVDDFHIIARPHDYDAKSGNFTLTLEILKQFGENGDVEESLTSLVMNGTLKKETEDTFILEATSSKTIMDRNNQYPTFQIIAGLSSTKPISQNLGEKGDRGSDRTVPPRKL